MCVGVRWCAPTAARCVHLRSETRSAEGVKEDVREGLHFLQVEQDLRTSAGSVPESCTTMRRAQDPIEPLSLLFPKEKGGVPPHVLKHAENAAHQMQRNLDLWEAQFDKMVEQIRKKQSWSSDGKIKGIDLDDSWR